MKKMIFSAVALVAFSFAGMANEIEEKKVEEASTERDCFLEADMTLRVWDALYGGSGLTEQEEARFMNILHYVKVILHQVLLTKNKWALRAH